MKRLVYSDDSVQRFKVGDDSTQIVLVPLTTDDDVNNTVDLSNQDCTVLIRNKNTYITKLVPEIDGTRVKFTSKNLSKLLPDEYFLELWTMDKTTHESKVYPDRDFLPLFINENAYGETGDPIKNVNMDVLREEMKAYIQEETKKLNLDDYYTKEQVDSAIKSNTVDLTPYLTVTDAEKTYAKTTDIPRVVLNTSDRTLSVGDTSINIPNNVDLSGYAKSDQIPNIAYDKSSNSINLNGVNIPIGSKVDLADYYTKEQVDSAIKSNKVDLTPYLTVTDAEKTYAKTTDVPRVTLNTSDRKLSVGNTSINIPDNASNYNLFVTNKPLKYVASQYDNYGMGHDAMGSDISLSDLLPQIKAPSDVNTAVTPYYFKGDNYYNNVGDNIRVASNFAIIISLADKLVIKYKGYIGYDRKYVAGGTANVELVGKISPEISYDKSTNTLTVDDQQIKLSAPSSSSSATYSTNFSPRLTGDQPVTDWNIMPDNLTSKLGDTTYEFIKLNNGDQRDELSPSASDLNNAKRTTSVDNLQEGVCWLAITSGNGFQEEKQYPFGSAWYLNSNSPLSATVKVVQYDKVAKKYVVPTQGGASLMSLLPGKQSITADMLNNGYQIRPYLDNMTPWVVTDYVAGGDYVHNDWFKAMVGKKVSQVFNILMTGSPEPEGSTTLVNYPSKDSTDDNKQATAPVTLLVTKIGNGTGSLSLNGNDVDKTMLTYQHPEVVNDRYELKFTGNYDGYIMITAYKGDHLVVIRKNGHALPATRKYMTTGAQAFTPTYITKLNSGNNDETLYPFGIRPIHITLANG